MDKSGNFLFLLIRLGLGTFDDNCQKSAALHFNGINWHKVYDLAQRQGVLAIAWDGIEVLLSIYTLDQLQIPRSLKIKWAVNADVISQRYNMQWSVAKDLAEKYKNDGISTVVLKGFAISQLYPVPSHRPCGDLDCFLMGEYERGNLLAESYSASVERDFYVHSHIVYKGLVVENHQFCTPIRGNKKAKSLEKAIQDILRNEQSVPINDSSLLSPSPLFSAIFLTVHAHRHFITEGICIRHLIDWAIILKHHVNNIDWNRFVSIINEYNRGILVFAECLTQIAHKHLNTPYVCISDCQSDFSNIVLNNIMSESIKVNTNNYNVWHKRWLIISNYCKSRWKFKYFSDTSWIKSIYNIIYGYIFDNNPKL